MADLPISEAGGNGVGAATSETEILLSQQRPWPGMRPYREQDAAYYFGRDAEIDELVARTERAPLTLLYARGGLGKTSLLRAGLAPRLVERAYLPIYLRPRGLLEGGRDPIAEVLRAIGLAVAASGIEATADFGVASLWELFHRQDFDLWDSTNRLVTPVLMFDQFEEIFQVVDEDADAAPRVRALLEGIAELVENRVPQRLVRRDEPGDAGPRFDIASKDYRVLLSFREDYLPQVRKLRAIVPSVVENHVRLEALSGQQALQVVEGAGSGLIDREAAALLVTSVGRPAGLLQRLIDPQAAVSAAGVAISVEVEPAILSVVCFHLNSERLQRRQTTIDVGLVRRRSAEDIFDDYYRSAIARVDAITRDFVETRLVTQGGERVLYPMREVRANGQPMARDLEVLLEQGVLRKEWFAGEQRLEISHDLLLRPIQRELELRRRRAVRGRRQRRAWFVGLAFVLCVVGVAAWYSVQTRLDSELAQREAIAEALLVAYVPLTDDTSPEQLKNEITRLIAEVDAGANSGERAQRLARLFDRATEIAAADQRGSARRLRDFSISYVQLKIDRSGLQVDDELVAPLVRKLRTAADSLCAQGVLLPDDRAVTWFTRRGGVPEKCL